MYSESWTCIRFFVFYTMLPAAKCYGRCVCQGIVTMVTIGKKGLLVYCISEQWVKKRKA